MYSDDSGVPREIVECNALLVKALAPVSDGHVVQSPG